MKILKNKGENIDPKLCLVLLLVLVSLQDVLLRVDRSNESLIMTYMRAAETEDDYVIIAGLQARQNWDPLFNHFDNLIDVQTLHY